MPVKPAVKRQPPAPAPFPAEDRAALATIALLARKSACVESTTELLTGFLVEAEVERAAAAVPRAGLTSFSSYVALAEAYPEVRALRCANDIRASLRCLQGCPPPVRTVHFTAVAASLEELYTRVIPDVLFAALAQVLRRWLRGVAAGGPGLPAREVTRPLEGQILKVVEALQLELLRQSKQLTERATTLTLRFRHQLPFC